MSNNFKNSIKNCDNRPLTQQLMFSRPSKGLARKDMMGMKAGQPVGNKVVMKKIKWPVLQFT
jgi:hypothetical protein